MLSSEKSLPELKRLFYRDFHCKWYYTICNARSMFNIFFVLQVKLSIFHSWLCLNNKRKNKSKCQSVSEAFVMDPVQQLCTATVLQQKFSKIRLKSTNISKLYGIHSLCRLTAQGKYLVIATYQLEQQDTKALFALRNSRRLLERTFSLNNYKKCCQIDLI